MIQRFNINTTLDTFRITRIVSKMLRTQPFTTQSTGNIALSIFKVRRNSLFTTNSTRNGTFVQILMITNNTSNLTAFIAIGILVVVIDMFYGSCIRTHVARSITIMIVCVS
jgi:hypothetical protein